MTQLWSNGTISKLKPFVKCERFRCFDIVATGITPHILLMNEMRSVREEFDTLLASIRENENGLYERLSKLPNEVCAEILKNITVNGAVPLTVTQIEDLLSSMEKRLILNQINHPPIDNILGSNLDNEASSNSNRSFIHDWGDDFIHLLPKDYIFPKTYNYFIY